MNNTELDILDYRLTKLVNGQLVAIVTLFKEAIVEKSVLVVGEERYNGTGVKIELQLYDTEEQERYLSAFRGKKGIVPKW